MNSGYPAIITGVVVAGWLVLELTTCGSFSLSYCNGEGLSDVADAALVLIEAEVAANLIKQRTADLGAELGHITACIVADVVEEEDDLWQALGASPSSAWGTPVKISGA